MRKIPACIRAFLPGSTLSAFQLDYEKVCLSLRAPIFKPEQEMDTLVEKAHSKGILCSPVIDAGRTQVEPNTHTVTFICPWYEDELNEITGHLRLL
ncbi:peptidyl-tRNA hydrolase, PTH2 family [Nematocida major]|uniref:peptidyl-tRNA hydrolase, PTH2 family n=1 Tax=Nematocida major TaxID=1912982 RepID=UPI002008DF1D|nr:peptidyl-tRNA hydrolase, PTH2 family [Nematocida major]KAH9387426.1 peptidyl-tRNA hydrolase, PTH2 family [Nematocida major]